MASVLLSSSSGSQNVLAEPTRRSDLSPRMRTFSENKKRTLFDNDDSGTEVVLAEKEGSLIRETNAAVDLIFLGQKNG